MIGPVRQVYWPVFIGGSVICVVSLSNWIAISIGADQKWAYWLPSVAASAAAFGVSVIFRRLSKAQATFSAAISELPDSGSLDTLAETLGYRGTLARRALIAIEKMRYAFLDEPEICLGICAFRDSRVAMMHVSADGVVFKLNSAAGELMRDAQKDFAASVDGFDPSNVEGMQAAKFSQRFGPFLQSLQVPGANPIDVEISIGKIIFAVNLSAVRSSDGSAAGNLLKWIDVTETHRATSVVRALRRTQLMLELDTECNLVDANEAFVARAGSDLASLKGRHFDDLLRCDPTSCPEFEAIWADLMAGRARTGLLELALPEGDEAYLRATLTPIDDSNGALASVVITAVDVTSIITERRAFAKERDNLVEAQQHAVARLEIALRTLASGDLSQQIDEPFSGSLESLRLSFNQASETLHWVISSVHLESEKIGTGSNTITKTTNALVKRAERQKNSVSNTITSLNAVTKAVSDSAEGSKSASAFVASVNERAEESKTIMSDAVNAMGEIEKSSSQISRIIGVIEDIAFQTNLLALNAGVEAARAGDSGRGFAVVATEVRALAQRSSEAAKQIKTLISESTGHVGNGVEFVNRAGEALSQIAGEVASIREQVSGIAETAGEQSEVFQGIAESVTELDRVNLRNMSTVEASIEAAQGLAQNSNELAGLVAKFAIRSDANETGDRPDGGSKALADTNRESVAGRSASRHELDRPNKESSEISGFKHKARNIAVAQPRLARPTVSISPHEKTNGATEPLDVGWEEF